ncbi:hypothetical protein AGR2A_pa30015 [Agrobacterium genomosp. 2 str. CFBP 5494]|uniref:Uncharacterized protein n=1 Tax=Agrobacterium genomosp. 2 str. CFBP 5494 TaxID=1183436 RepID=A0A9W5B6G9_9HYPH|nr:hypothetical protein AGR2A_pa30015 [Agrobacterium genomosp. 2 str. CFBP 5494]
MVKRGKRVCQTENKCVTAAVTIFDAVYQATKGWGYFEKWMTIKVKKTILYSLLMSVLTCFSTWRKTQTSD